MDESKVTMNHRKDQSWIITNDFATCHRVGCTTTACTVHVVIFDCVFGALFSPSISPGWSWNEIFSMRSSVSSVSKSSSSEETRFVLFRLFFGFDEFSDFLSDFASFRFRIFSARPFDSTQWANFSFRLRFRRSSASKYASISAFGSFL